MNCRGRTLWVKVLIWIAIGLTVVTFIGRIFYWQHVRAAEDNFVTWLGISPNVYEILKVAAAILGLGYWFIRYRPFRRRN